MFYPYILDVGCDFLSQLPTRYYLGLFTVVMIIKKILHHFCNIEQIKHINLFLIKFKNKIKSISRSKLPLRSVILSSSTNLRGDSPLKKTLNCFKLKIRLKILPSQIKAHISLINFDRSSCSNTKTKTCVKMNTSKPSHILNLNNYWLLRLFSDV